MGNLNTEQNKVTPMPGHDDAMSQTASMASNLSMYLRYYGLNEAPFTITPDPRYLFLSRRHQEGLAHLLFGVGQGGSGGFVQLTGEVGTGKTTLCRCLLEQVPEKTRIALILNPVLTPVELLATVCDELGLEYEEDSSSKMLMDLLTEYLLQAHAQGERVVVVIDEAQNLSSEALEQVRLLTNLETATDKLLQIVLLGQPELRQLLAQNDLRQLAQRITARYHLEPLDEAETVAYVKHRMAVAGAPRSPFTRGGLKALHRCAQGVPRLINIISDRALMGAFAADHARVGARIVRQAAREVQGGGHQASGGPWLKLAIIVGIVVATGLAGQNWYASRQVAAPINAETVASTRPDTTTTVAGAPVESAGDSLTEPRKASLSQLPIAENVDLLWRRYGQLWRSSEMDLRAECEDQSQGLFLCLRQSGTWQRIARLDLPVMLILENNPGLLLLGLRGNEALVHDGRGALSVPKSLLESQWLGEFWAAAPGRGEILSVQQGGAEVYRLKALAASLLKMPYAGPIDERFDPSLEHWVKAFQRQRGINADGIVGPATRLYLVAEAVSEPQLLEDW